jgi:hypothetical protein
MRALLIAILAAATGCAAPLPSPNTSDLVVVQVSTVPAIAAPVATAEPASTAAVEPQPAAAPLVGSWKWNDDVASYQGDGTGTYDRVGARCFEFTYTVSGDVLTTIADRDHSCGAHRTTSYRVEVEGDTLTMTHIGSGFVTGWKRQ